MLSKMSGFLPVRCSSDMAIHCAQGTNAKDPLVWEESQYSDDGLTPTPSSIVCLEEFMQSCHVDEDGQDEAIERQEGEHGKHEWELDEKEHPKRHRYHECKECLHFRQDEYIERQ